MLPCVYSRSRHSQVLQHSAWDVASELTPNGAAPKPGMSQLHKNAVARTYRLPSAFATMGGVTGFLNIVAATGGAALLLYSTDALFYYTDERYGFTRFEVTIPCHVIWCSNAKVYHRRAAKHEELDLKRRALEVCFQV